jgi:ArsR family transcriptional regulator
VLRAPSARDDLFARWLDIRQLLAILPISQQLERSMKPRRFSQQVKIFKALAHETRMLVVDELSRGERCVCELTGLVGVDISTMSKHLSVLREAGIVESEKRGMQVYYRLLTPCVLKLFTCVHTVSARMHRARHGESE